MVKKVAGRKKTSEKEVYTYRCGKKLLLKKKPDQFVVRQLPEVLEAEGFPKPLQVSSASSRITVKSNELEGMMKKARKISCAHHSYCEVSTGNEFLITDRIIVTFSRPLSVEEVGKFAGDYALTIVKKYTDRKFMFQLTDKTGMNPVKLIVRLMEHEKDKIDNAEHDLNMRFKKSLDLPTDPSFNDQWHLHTHRGHAEVDARSSARCEEAWQLMDNYGDHDVVIAISDDGCQLSHTDFDSQGKFAGWGYFRGITLHRMGDAGAVPNRMYEQGANHGTSCAGVVAAEVDGLMTTGAAPECRLLPIKWESDGPSLFISDDKLLTLLDYIENRVDIFSNSWGNSPSSNWSQDVIDRITQLSVNGGRRGNGIVFLWAAGNENCPISHSGNTEVPYTDGWERDQFGDWQWVGVDTARVFSHNLVDIPGVMHVAALASTAQRSHYSNYGTGIMICAPSSNSHAYYRLFPDGLGITTTTGSTGGVRDSFGGTSSATPLVAGIAALVISANPDLSAEEVIAILKQTASKDLSLQGYPRTPPTSDDLDTSWDVSPIAPFDSGDFQDIGNPDGTWSPWFGYGKVDAANAVAEALRRGNPEDVEEIQKSSNPGLDIPEYSVTGIIDTIEVVEAGRLKGIKAGVDITHSFIGDLKVTLVSPSGESILLHDRSGGSTQDLNKTYDLTTTPSLGALLNLSIRGTWILRIQDLAHQDDGRLNRWNLDFEVQTVGIIDVEESPGVTIPDNDPNGIERNLQIDELATIKNISVSVDITHTFIRDIHLSLTSPAGNEIVVLHNREGGNADNIIKTYDASTTPGLADLKNQSTQGTWRLKVVDLEGADIGKLNYWSLRILTN